MKKYLVIMLIFVSTILTLSACRNNKETIIEEVSKEIGAFEAYPQSLSTAGIYHEPFGRDQLYGDKEAPEIWWTREPYDPIAADEVIINAALTRDGFDSLELLWTLNGEIQENVPMKTKAILEIDSQRAEKISCSLGTFSQGDVIEYIIVGKKDGEVKDYLGVFSFSVMAWEKVEEVSSFDTSENGGILNLKTKSLTKALNLSFSNNTVNFTISDKIHSDGKAESNIELSSSSQKLLINTTNFGFELLNFQGNSVLKTSNTAIEFLTDGTNVLGFRINLEAKEDEAYYGFGMKYNSLDQRDEVVDIYCVNWYTQQIGESYTPIPFYFVPNTYGIFVNSTYYSQFDMDSQKNGEVAITVNCKNDDINLSLYSGTNDEILDAYTNTSAKPVLPPVWAFGPWISANEWNKQSEILEQLEKTLEYNIPTSVIVIEAWSDEETFYTFNDSQFNVQDGSYVPKLSDFEFSGKWYDPKSMIDELHENDVKVLLWQIPVLKASASATTQSLNDQTYAKENNLVLEDSIGNPYRLPANTWFGNSLLVDFTNPTATQWFLSKREYLLKELGVDGFKTDGGEFVWGRDVESYAGINGNELRNLYPDLYAQAYFDFSRGYVDDAITFSRAGGASMQAHPICWIGDQKSTVEAFESAILAMQSVSMSGVPFVAWDIAGFSGDVPTSELYQRSVAQGAFSPIMQIHSETSGDPNLSQARTPWNMAERKGNDACLETYRYYANLRMNLMPYIYTQARNSSLTGEPFVGSMAYAFPDEKEAHKYELQYMFGEDMLVAPVTDLISGEVTVYLPEGKWFNFFTGEEFLAGVHTIKAELWEIPVFVKEGALIPVNLGDDLALGSSVGNELESYNNMCFISFSAMGDFSFYDYVNEKEISLNITEETNSVSMNGLEIITKID